VFCALYRLKGLNNVINMDGVEWRGQVLVLVERLGRLLAGQSSGGGPSGDQEATGYAGVGWAAESLSALAAYESGVPLAGAKRSVPNIGARNVGHAAPVLGTPDA
jgi:hypothetical protein